MNSVRRSLRDSSLTRWSVLLILSLIMAANYFFYDVLSPLQNVIRDRLHFSNTAYGFLQSAYSIAECIFIYGDYWR